MNILFLHGYTQSGPSFSAKTKAVQKALTKALGAQTTLHFPTAPHHLQLSDIPGFNPSESVVSPGDEDAFAWWRWLSTDSSPELRGLAETLVFLSEYLDRHGPFAGVIGFSQGAACAALLASILERPGRPQEFKTHHGPLRFAVCYSGFRVSERYEHWYAPKISIPTLHVIGSLDTVVEEERSLQLAKCCENGEERVVYHPGGHYLPATKNMVGVLAGFIRSCCEEKVDSDL